MKKKLLSLIAGFLLLFASSVDAAYYIRAFTGIQGETTGTLDNLTCVGLQTNDLGLVFDVSASSMYFYKYNTTDTSSEDTTHNSVVYAKDRNTNCSSQGAWLLFDSMNFAPSSAPSIAFRDSDSDASDKTVAKIEGQYLSTNPDGSISLQVYIAGTLREILLFDADTEAMTLGDSNSGEDLVLDFDTGTANQVDVTSNSGVNEIDWGAIAHVTTGEIEGKIPWGTEITGAVTLGDQVDEVQGKLYIVDISGATTVTLAQVSTVGFGACVTFWVQNATNVLTIEINASDKINLHGTPLTAGNTIDSPGNAGDFITLCSTTDADGSGTDGWTTFGYGEDVWTDGGAT